MKSCKELLVFVLQRLAIKKTTKNIGQLKFYIMLNVQYNLQSKVVELFLKNCNFNILFIFYQVPSVQNKVME